MDKDKENQIKEILKNMDSEILCDSFGRVTNFKSPLLADEIGYYQKGDHATNLVSSITQRLKNQTINRQKYIYDANGNISEIRENGKLVARYTYDGLNRLIREDNATLEKSYTFEYDVNGNITYKTEFAFNLDNNLTNGKLLEYSYCAEGLRDRLESFNGEKCEYDDLGNPTLYRGKVMSWSHVRNLKSINGSINFDYNASGIRTIKTANDVETKYYYLDSRLLAEKRLLRTGDLSLGDNVYDSEIYYTYTDKTDISYMYNANELTSFTIARNGTHQTYYYRKNLMGDITHIYDSLGNLKAEYNYDAWGNHTVVKNEDNIANINPFRYRGYYYDTETGLYYLQSRYYDPQTGRFINADAISILDESKDMVNGLNLFAYCGNNPVMRTDEEGTSWWTDFWDSTFGKIVGTILVVVAVVGLTILTAGVGGAVTAALGGGFWAAVAGGAVGGALSGAIFGAGFSIASQGIANGYSNVDWGKVGIDTLIGIASGAMMGAAFAAGGRALGLLGKTNWAQRTLNNFGDKTKNLLFGSKSGNFTFLRLGKGFRLEASIQHGLHMHYQTIKNGLITIGASVPRTTLINAIWNSLIGMTSSSIRQFAKYI